MNLATADIHVVLVRQLCQEHLTITKQHKTGDYNEPDALKSHKASFSPFPTGLRAAAGVDNIFFLISRKRSIRNTDYHPDTSCHNVVGQNHYTSDY